MDLTVNNKQYRIEFRHISKHGKRAQLHKGSVQAVTTCVLIADQFIAIDNALCSASDLFSRREGRMRALNKLLDHCGPMRAIKGDFFSAYLKLDPEPVLVERHARLTDEQRAELKAAGQAGKLERRRHRQEMRQRRRAGAVGR